MSEFNNGEKWNGSITITKQNNTNINIDTEGRYVKKDIQLTINVQAGSAATPATTITTDPSITVDGSTGLITASNNATQSITPSVSEGYVSQGTSGNVTVSGSNTLRLTTKGATEITPTTSDQIIEAGQFLTGTQTIKAIPYAETSNLSDGYTAIIGG